MALLSFGQATNDAMRLAMRADDRVILLGEDIRWGGSFGQYQGLHAEFGDRVIDMPISEAIIVSTAIGAAVTGLRPVASLGFIDFALGAMDEIGNQAAKLRYMFGGQVSVPFVLRAADGSIRSAAAQHSQNLEALFAHIPGIKVVAPSNAFDAKGLLISAIEDDDPVIYLENKKIQPLKADVPEGIYRVPIGHASVVREGSDVTIIAYSVMAHYSREACDILSKQHGIEAELIDLRTLVPLDFATLERSVRKTGRAIVCHEAWTFGGFGAEVAAELNQALFGLLRSPILRVGAKNAHIPFAPVLESAVVPSMKDIVATALMAVGAHPAAISN
jgi:acetoin:2,6-dichlorophenolindophenol oxidoreductase subunit beta